jgi:MATE family multidrug resistance protein
MRFGFPSGVQFFIDIAGLTMFIFFVGRIGPDYLAATNIAFNINTVAFQPMIGTGIAISVLVGQKLGRNHPGLAERSVWSGFHITFLYMATIAALYILVPDIFLGPYLSGTEYSIGTIYEITIVLLRFVAFYSLFDAFTIVFASAINGAGDTRFVMTVISLLSIFVLVIPSYTAIVFLGEGIYTAWVIATVYVSLLGVIFWIRFNGGKWKRMRVIEAVPSTLPPIFPETPFYEPEK